MVDKIRKVPQTGIEKKSLNIYIACISIFIVVFLLSVTLLNYGFGIKHIMTYNMSHEAEDAAREEMLYKHQLHTNDKEPTTRPPGQRSQSKKLCLHKNEVVDCNKGNSTDHACLGDEGPTKCVNLEDDVNNSICADVETNFLVTCDIFSSIRLCFADNDKMIIQPCSGRHNYVCLTQDGKTTACEKVYNQGNHPLLKDFSEQSATENQLSRTTDEGVPEVKPITFLLG